ncbi:MAG: hypothetical protein NT167_28705 [Verrucomicrobia bacterium]|nr:hypothetical protein [Verrucomicrobiota bacterium]
MVVTETSKIPAVGAPGSAVARPGISPEMLARAGVRRVSAAEALELCGLEQSGMWLPYWTAEGTALSDGGKIRRLARASTPICRPG